MLDTGLAVDDAGPGHARVPLLRQLGPPAIAILAYLGIRLVGLIVLWIFVDEAGVDFWRALNGRFDSNWYAGIADRGYDATIRAGSNGQQRPTNLAFFPLYPALTASLTLITPLPTASAGLVISWLAGIAAAWGIYRVGALLRSHQTGVLLTLLWGALPHAIVQNMAYSETLFTALVAWSLYALLLSRWVAAGVLSLFAGLTRPTAIALIAAVIVTALAAVLRRHGEWRAWIGMGLAPLGYLGYLAWVGNRLHRIDGYFYLQREAWGIYFDGGRFTARSFVRIMTEPSWLALYLVAVLIGLALVLLVLSWTNRLPAPVLVYSTATVLFVLGAAGSFHGKGRYLMPAFTLLLPVAYALSATQARTRIAVLTVLALTSAWYGSYLCLQWGYSP